MKNRKIPALLLALVMSLSCLCVSALAADVKMLTIRYTGAGSDKLTVSGGNVSQYFEDGTWVGTLSANDGSKWSSMKLATIVIENGKVAETEILVPGSQITANTILRFSLINSNTGNEVYGVWPDDSSTSGATSGSNTSSGSTGGTSAGGASAGGAAGGAVAAATNVEVSKASNGTVKVSNTAAKAGDKVTVTLTPSTGYEADTLTVKDKSGATVEATKNADGTYTFTMPAASKLPVSVSATFKKAETKPVDNGTGFVDVAADAYYADAVKWAVAQGITNGKDAADTFKPNDVCTRAEAVTFLYRAAGAPDVALSSQFKDVAGDAYYAKAVAWAVANGITNGKDAANTFCPTDTCSRAEIVTFLARYEKATAGDASRFIDVNASDWFAGSVGWAVGNGITNGKDANNTFKPADTCTRAEIVTFLYRDFVK